MRVDVTPQAVTVVGGEALALAVRITNTTTVIGGYVIRVLGADPGWVELEADQISLFPDESRTLVVQVTLPAGLPSGVRRIAIQVRELTPPEESTIAEVELTVPSTRSMQLRVDPLATTAGRRANFSVVVENTGNTAINGYLSGDDPEGKVRFDFVPESLTLAPGEHAVADLRASARRHLTGSPQIRTLNLYLDEPSPDAFLPALDSEKPRADRPPLASATFIQRAVLSRGALALVGLLAAVTVFAIVITVALSRLVSQSTADRDLALQIAADRGSSSSGTSGVAGTVRLLTTGKPVPAVSVDIFTASDTSTPIATTATGADGKYALTNLAAGSYKVGFQGAGFVQIWYPGATSDANAKTITLNPGQIQYGLDVTLGGVPATISGTVTGNDVSNATLYLMTVAGSGTTTPASGSARPLQAPAQPTPPPDNGGAVVQSIPIGSDGKFDLSNVPSPSVYNLVVTKAGYATTTERIDVAAGESRTGVQLTLSQGDGLISGIVTSPTGLLGGVTLTATSGQTTVTTVSLTDRGLGTFTLRSLPTPASITLVASKDGYASQTLTLTLTAGQKLTGVAITLTQSAGNLEGIVTLVPSGQPAGGVAVTVSNGVLTVQSGTQSSGAIGHWTVGGLPLPGTYTVTFSRADLAAQTVSVSLDANGNITPGSQGATITSSGISIGLRSATATVYGTISQLGATECGDGSSHLGEATVTVNSGSTTYTVTSATVPQASCGQYRIEQLPPGTYTITVSAGSGTIPVSSVITLAAGDVRPVNVTLARPAAMSGTVVETSTHGPGLCGWTVDLYQQAQYPTVRYRTTMTSAAVNGTCSGAFSFGDIPAGTYILAVGPTPGNASVTKTVAIQPSQQLTGVTVVVPG